MRIPRISATGRITLSLVGLSSSLLMLAALIGIIPDRRPIIAEERSRLCHTLTVNFSTLAQLTDEESIRRSFAKIAENNEDIQSIGLRRNNSELIFEVGDHNAHWTLRPTDRSTPSQMIVPILADGKTWGTLEVRFKPIYSSGIAGLAQRPEVLLWLFLSLTNLVAYYFFLRLVLRQLNPSKVVPTRVRDALDTLAEGLLILDQNNHIVLANRTFTNVFGEDVNRLIGKSIDDIRFVCREEQDGSELPWAEATSKNTQVLGKLLSFDSDDYREKTFSVSAAPIHDANGKSRGLLVSFEDVSTLENKKQELRQTVEQLHLSSEKIKSQNRELEHLATRDPLTECFNRRSFFERFEDIWRHSIESSTPIASIMVDVDHFKSINDNHGHSMGDLVLQRVSKCIRDEVSDEGLVCRYGGEEFVVLLKSHNLGDGARMAERIRVAISELEFEAMSITASLGVAEIDETTPSPQDLLDHADKAMYLAKRTGRNQVIRWDEVPDDLVVDESAISRIPEEKTAAEVTIPFNAVTALFSALAYRDQATASHSRRVADLAVMVARDLLPLRQCYTLEIAALLHDIGKVGVPDAILLKPGPLTDEEWKVMHSHDHIGTEIIRASFASPELSAIIESHHAFFGGNNDKPHLPSGQQIPVGARLLSISDAFDAMISDRVYRKGRPKEQAFEELRRCSGTQFDPELVERFISIVGEAPLNEQAIRQQVSRELALSIGTQIERLSEMLDDQNLVEIRSLADRLGTTAVSNGAEPIAAKASELVGLVDDDEDLLEIMSSANELLDLCRATQRQLLYAEDEV